jgi:hypothetical protein
MAIASRQLISIGEKPTDKWPTMPLFKVPRHCFRYMRLWTITRMGGMTATGTNPYKHVERSLQTTMRDGQYTLIWKAFQSGVVISLCDVSDDDSHELINHCLVESDDHAAADNNRCT